MKEGGWVGNVMSYIFDLCEMNRKCVFIGSITSYSIWSWTICLYMYVIILFNSAKLIYVVNQIDRL